VEHEEPARADRTLKQILQGLGEGVAVVNPGTLEIEFENATFFRWFPTETDEAESLKDRITALDIERARARLEAGKIYTFETETKGGARAVPVRVAMKHLDSDAGPRCVVEVRDIAKEKEAQYMLDSYSKLAEKHARDLEKEKDRVERLLLNVMPKSVFEEMKDFGTTTPQMFNEASVIMLDFVGFTSMAISSDPAALISELNDIFSAFDRIVDNFGCERIKTIGDAYMAVSGVPEENPDHTKNVARVALRFRRYLERRNQAHTQQWLARIGINTGPIIGSLVGIQKYVYDIFGPGVNIAARMEAASEPMKITLNEDTYQLLKNDFTVAPREIVDIKGFGPQQLYFLETEIGDRL
jgi:adenylate cyclase